MKYDVKMSDEDFKKLLELTNDEIKTAAYHKWEAAGHPMDEDSRHYFWLEAEKEIFLKIGLITIQSII